MIQARVSTALGVGRIIGPTEPVDTRRAASSAANRTLMRGALGAGAGGWSRAGAMALALPQPQQFRPPTVPPSQDVRLIELYGSQPVAFRHRLQSMFRVPPTQGPAAK